MALATAREVGSWPTEQRDEFISGLSEEEAMVFLYDWNLWARPSRPRGEAITSHFCPVDDGDVTVF